MRSFTVSEYAEVHRAASLDGGMNREQPYYGNVLADGAEDIQRPSLPGTVNNKNDFRSTSKMCVCDCMWQKYNTLIKFYYRGKPLAIFTM